MHQTRDISNNVLFHRPHTSQHFNARKPGYRSDQCAVSFNEHISCTGTRVTQTRGANPNGKSISFLEVHKSLETQIQKAAGRSQFLVSATEDVAMQLHRLLELHLHRFPLAQLGLEKGLESTRSGFWTAGNIQVRFMAAGNPLKHYQVPMGGGCGVSRCFDVFESWRWVWRTPGTIQSLNFQPQMSMILKQASLAGWSCSYCSTMMVDKCW